jgi:hypothetical protein
MSEVPVGPQPLPKLSLEQRLAAFDSVPLFMKSLPEEDTDDPMIAALQSLAYEGTPDGRFVSFSRSITAMFLDWYQRLRETSRSKATIISKANASVRH